MVSLCEHTMMLQYARMVGLSRCNGIKWCLWDLWPHKF